MAVAVETVASSSSADAIEGTASWSASTEASSTEYSVSPRVVPSGGPPAPFSFFSPISSGFIIFSLKRPRDRGGGMSAACRRESRSPTSAVHCCVVAVGADAASIAATSAPFSRWKSLTGAGAAGAAATGAGAATSGCCCSGRTMRCTAGFPMNCW